MKTKITFALVLFSISIFGKEVPVDKAKTAALNFLIQNTSSQLKGSTYFNLKHLQYSTTHAFDTSGKKSAPPLENLIYVFEINENDGFIIVAGDDDAVPILAYSFDNEFDVENAPYNFKKWIEGYKNQIRYIRANPGHASNVTEDKWDLLISGKNESETQSHTSIAPLLTTKWNQSPFYNDLCPYDQEYGENSVTGCVATAMAQIMKYWDYPETGNGFHSYNHSEFGVISANFGTTQYNWTAMPDVLNSDNPAIATLMFHCGVSVDMNYSAKSSGAYVAIDASPVEQCSENAFKEYFAYDSGLNGVLRDNYETDAWLELLKAELEAGRPMEYAGFGAGGGHAFVCDGFDSNDFFHFNWGWGGYYDGYFAIDALDPNGTGTGGGSGGYNYGQHAIIGIKPPDNVVSYDLSLYDSVTISENPLFFTDSFIIHSDIGNYGAAPFTGDFCAAIFDADNNFVEFAEILEGAVLEGGMHYTHGLDFSNSGSLELLPGDYYAGIFYRPIEGNWKAVEGGDYTNDLSFEVYYSNDIELYKDFVITAGSTITQNEPFSVTTDILNDGTSTFAGEFAIDLFDMDGEHAATIDTRTGADLEAGYYYSDIEFKSEGVSVAPGTYLMALFHKPDGGIWALSGSSYFTNPTKVIVKEAPLLLDIYEENDSEDNPYLLTVNFIDNTASISTEGSNSHIGTDMDFYSIVCEEGFDYSISTRTYDSYSSGNQEMYTNDVIWSYYANGEWSEAYDDVMPGSFDILNGGEVLFGVAPYYEGETGTYLLDIQITRTDLVSIETAEESYLKVYPNPASNILNIEGSRMMDRIDLYDVKGRVIYNSDENSQNTSINISDLKEGVYFLHVTQEDHTTIHKIVKQ